MDHLESPLGSANTSAEDEIRVLLNDAMETHAGHEQTGMATGRRGAADEDENSDSHDDEAPGSYGITANDFPTFSSEGGAAAANPADDMASLFDTETDLDVDVGVDDDATRAAAQLSGMGQGHLDFRDEFAPDADLLGIGQADGSVGAFESGDWNSLGGGDDVPRVRSEEAFSPLPASPGGTKAGGTSSGGHRSTSKKGKRVGTVIGKATGGGTARRSDVVGGGVVD